MKQHQHDHDHSNDKKSQTLKKAKSPQTSKTIVKKTTKMVKKMEQHIIGTMMGNKNKEALLLMD